MIHRIIIISNMFSVTLRRLFPASVRSFRSRRPNIYTTSNVVLTDKEREEQKSLPVWDRVFDHRKYIVHEGPLKMATGLALVDVEPFPRLKLMKLYYLTLEEMKSIPDVFSKSNSLV